jgi:hypothetical protein
MSVPHVLFILTNTHEIGPNGRATGYFFPEVAHPFEVFDRSGGRRRAAHDRAEPGVGRAR